MDEKTKICSKCKQEKLISDFQKSSRRKSGFTSICKECANKINNNWRKENKNKVKRQSKEYYLKNKEKLNKRCKKNYQKNRKKHIERSRAAKLKRLYGLTPDDYNSMFEAQQGRCAICGTHNSELKHPLGIDHNHITNKNRDLLCTVCNLAIGMLKADDGTFLLEEAIKYVQKHKDI